MQAEGSPHYRSILVNISVIGIHKGEEGQGILHTYLAIGEIEKAYESYKKHSI